MTERALASIRKISALSPIEGADRIELASVDGWNVVVNKGLYNVGDVVVYLEIDSFVPKSIAPFLTKEGHYPKEFNGVQGERLRTVKLRGQLSQGLILPIDTVLTEYNLSIHSYETHEDPPEGLDVTGMLGVQKWERPLPACLQGQAKGTFPSFIQKTDEERCQNIANKIFGDWKDYKWEISIKLDGSSFTGYCNRGDTGVCSRNLELKDSEENSGNTFVRMFHQSGLKDALCTLGYNVAVQAELMGPGIQGNRENLETHQLYIFKVWDIDSGVYLSPKERESFIGELVDSGYKGSVAPILRLGVSLPEMGVDNLADLLQYTEGESLNNPVREGLVFKCMDKDVSFKAISNKFLLKGGD